MGEEGRIRTLSQLGLTARDGREARVTGLSVDSRDVRDGHLFAALPGTRMHGAEFVSYALRMGAAAVLTDREGAQLAASGMGASGAALVVTEDPRQALAFAASLWFGAQPETVVAVTGTNGKTSVATFTRQIWEALGLAAVNVGTTGVEGAWSTPLKHTTPEPVTLHRVLAEAAAAGVTHAAMEASSHGLEQRRLDGVRLRAAAFSNFSQDHLDYHPDFDAYFAAKAGLFDRVLPDDGVAVLNLDDAKGQVLAERVAARRQDILTVGRHEAAALRILDQRFEPGGQTLRYSWAGRTRQARLALIGGFQGGNVLLSAGLAVATGSEPDEVFAVLPRLAGVRGRMQRVAERADGGAVYVDYAHTPEALATALQALRPHVMGRLVVVFGAGGDRDRGKRPLMGAAATAHADLAFVTDDNPRTEDRAAIRRAILQAAPDAIEVPDRAEAILRGVDALQPGDALLIAGKGHETGQIVGETVYPFDDAEQASVAVAALDGRVA
ncbi:UDP-N-acetylmuramoyl-L-alanyl-D-glutamate--2,6-diaminopimelate ligase [Roseitranquillus sediminis]|uniref:UDP-N-acetylmuramoyl-L-alanyl-D-glutamate--2, 6-diaminopimelate ligase n=1 Tax=Roseitranquillus sediminis TaxID=2809051 RepID=UPI001D0CAB58|nr:UDP-N-acetylmuramoyl-L-alanyl-D-glutamate--2,6-diaminopimelate ligase [Roseitranquillus sediminis]MBM9594597.1 UDP-N-acetylmuramoyl-L-alanyl-D-glutamate--2,6-diaminopimelate ligase [Roseitranquillus sediminis]